VQPVRFQNQFAYLNLLPYYLITKHLAEPSSLPLNAYEFNKIGLKDKYFFIRQALKQAN